jgi:acetolactate synthase I/II/III large subunit
MTGADLIARILKAEGVSQVFNFPFSPIVDAIAGTGTRVITTRQERVAGNMADGVSRSTNGHEIGVWTVQASAGSENAFAGVAHAYTDSVPMLYLPGHPGIDAIGVSPTFDSEANYAATTKAAMKVFTPEHIQTRMRRAYQALRSGRPRPVMVEIPGDVARAEFKGEYTYEPVAPVRSGPDGGAVKEAAERLLAAENAMIWAGQGVHWAEAYAELRDVAELLGIPVMTTLMGKSAFDETHELSAGTGAAVVTAMAAHYLRECDALLVVGSSLSEASFTPTVGPGKLIVHATNDAVDLNKTHPIAVAILSDAKLFLAALAEELRRIGADRTAIRKTNVETLARIRAAWEAEYESEFSDDSSPINGYRMFRELWSVLDPATSILSHESGSVRDIQCVFHRATTPRGYLGWGQSSQLGYSLGLAMGAKLANPDKTVVNVMGDASIGMTGMDLATASQYEIPILTVMKHDSIFSGYDKHIPVAIERYGTSTMEGDYAALAQALGCHAERVETVADLRPALERGIAATKEGRPAFVDVITKETRKLSRLDTVG